MVGENSERFIIAFYIDLGVSISIYTESIISCHTYVKTILCTLTSLSILSFYIFTTGILLNSVRQILDVFSIWPKFEIIMFIFTTIIISGIRFIFMQELEVDIIS